MRIPPETVQLVSELVADAPELKRAYDEHVQENDGVLPHVFFSDLTRFVLSGFVLARGPRRESAQKLLARLEQAYSGKGHNVRELIVLSFIGNIERGQPGLDNLRASMASPLRSELDQQLG